MQRLTSNDVISFHQLPFSAMQRLAEYMGISVPEIIVVEPELKAIKDESNSIIGYQCDFKRFSFRIMNKLSDINEDGTIYIPINSFY